jgi:hypothetical protein
MPLTFSQKLKKFFTTKEEVRKETEEQEEMSAATIAMIAERDADLLSQVTVPGLREWYLEKEAEEFERSSPEYIAAMEKQKSSPAYIEAMEKDNATLKAENTKLKTSQQLNHWFFEKNIKVLEDMEAEIAALKAQVMFLNTQRIVLLAKYEPESLPGKAEEAEADEEKEKEKDD